MWRESCDQSSVLANPVHAFEDAWRIQALRRAIAGNVAAGLIVFSITTAMGLRGAWYCLPLLAVHAATWPLVRRNWKLARAVWLATVHLLFVGLTYCYGHASNSRFLWVVTIPLTYVVFRSDEQRKRCMALSLALGMYTTAEFLGAEGLLPGVVLVQHSFAPSIMGVAMLLITVQRTQLLSDFNISAREHLIAQHDHLEEAQATSNVGSFTACLTTGITAWSRGMFLLHGFDPSGEVPDKDAYLQRVAPEDRIRLEALLHNPTDLPDDALAIEYNIHGADGPRTMHWSARFVRDTNGAPVRLTGSVRDITQQRRDEAALVRAREAAEQASQSKSMFLANMSHELRTPMNGVLGMTALALDTYLTSAQRSFLTSAHSSGIALLTILNDILDLSKVEAGKLDLEQVTFSIRTVVSQALGLVTPRAEERRLKLSSAIDGDVPERQLGDPVRVRQLLVNLLGNAVKFTDEGSVRVEVRCADGSPERLSIRVIDTGVGIPEARLGSIFEAFTQADGSTTRRYGGTGLGLTISAKLARLMRGSLDVQSVVGEGSVFCATLQLPSASPELPDHAHIRVRPVTGVKPRSAPRASKVLIAEDNPVNARIATKVVEKLGHHVTVVTDGQAALKALTQERFDAVLMDVQMPVMDGLEAAREIRERERGTDERMPIIAMTASAMKGDEEMCLAAGMDAYISKPLDFTAVFEALSKYVTDAAAPTRSGEHAAASADHACRDEGARITS